jgi:hypothetical protein
MARLICAVAMAALALPGAVTAQDPSLGQLLSRMDGYLRDYQASLSTVLAEERYVQESTNWISSRSSSVFLKRTLSSDFVFMRLPGDVPWLGFRDTFTVDGKPVRDHDARLSRVLSSGAPDALSQAVRIAEENARYNLGDIDRTINVPMTALDLMRPDKRDRFHLQRGGYEKVNGLRLWRIDFREEQRPTIIRTRAGGNQPSRGSVWIDPASGAIMQTVLNLGEPWPDVVQTRMTVVYRADEAIGALVPYEMIEHYYRIQGERTQLQVNARATYTNFRRFETGARVLTSQ